MRQFAVAGGINNIQSGADYGNTACLALQSSTVGGTVNPQRHPADNTQAVVAQMASKAFSIGEPLRRGVAASDDSQCRKIEKLALAFDVKQWRRVGNFQQGSGVVHIRQGNDVIEWIFKPFKCRSECLEMGSGADEAGDRSAYDFLQSGIASGENVIRFTKGLQQAPVAFPAQAMNQAQGDPQGKLMLLVNQGFLTTSSR